MTDPLEGLDPHAPAEHRRDGCWCGHPATTHRPDPVRDYREDECIACKARLDPLLDLPYEPAAGGPIEQPLTVEPSQALVLASALVDHPTEPGAKIPAILFRFLMPDGTSFYRDRLLVIPPEQLDDLARLVTDAIAGAKHAAAQHAAGPPPAEPLGSTYEITEGGHAIRCLRCGCTSWNPNDIAQLYCGKCNVFHAGGGA